MTLSAISVVNLTKTFPGALCLMGLGSARSKGAEVLRGIDLEVPRGAVFGLLGSNGGGKTTLLEILATYLLPSGGLVSVHGHDVARAPLDVRRVVGYCPAGARGFDLRLPGRWNLEFFALLSNLPRRHARERVARLWELVGLDGFKDNAVAHYSCGMRQRLALARALLTDPPVLLLDEPTRGLDPEASALWRRFLRERTVEELGKTILLVTHDLLEAEDICDRMAIMERGKIVAVGTPGEILGVPRSRRSPRAWAVAGEG